MNAEFLSIYEEKNEKEFVDIFLESKREYIEKYGKELPIPNEELKVAIVVPILAEYANGNFWRLLQSIASQKEVSQEYLEVICVINNSNAVAERATAKAEDNEDEEVTIRINRFLENQTNLFVIDAIRGSQEDYRKGENLEVIEERMIMNLRERGVELTGQELVIVRNLLSSKACVIAVDCSTAGRGLRANSNESPVGIAVDIGTAIACDRLTKKGDLEGLIGVIDGDCFISDGFFKEVFEMKNEGVKVVEIPTHTSEEDYKKTDKDHVAVSPVVLSKVNGYCRSNAHGSTKFVEMVRAVVPEKEISTLQKSKVILPQNN